MFPFWQIVLPKQAYLTTGITSNFYCKLFLKSYANNNLQIMSANIFQRITILYEIYSKILTQTIWLLTLESSSQSVWLLLDRILDIRLKTLDIRFRTSDIRPRISDIGHRTSDIRHQISDISHQKSDIRHRTWNIGHRTSNIRRRTSDIGHQTSDIRHQTSDIRR